MIERWNRDCLALKPHWISLLIGINDMWRRYDQGDPTPVDRFEQEYRILVDRINDELNARLILCEPFLLPITEDHMSWREDLDPKIEVVHRLAREFKAILVPLDKVFKEASLRQIPAYWAPDGVHPSLAGHALIAQAWLRHVGA